MMFSANMRSALQTLELGDFSVDGSSYEPWNAARLFVHGSGAIGIR